MCVGGGEGVSQYSGHQYNIPPSLSPGVVPGLPAAAGRWSLLFLVSHFRLILEISSTEAGQGDWEHSEDSMVYNSEN